MPDDKTFDVRTLERKLRRGLISRKDYDKHLKTLADRADNMTTIGAKADLAEARAAAADDDDEDDDEE